MTAESTGTGTTARMPTSPAALERAIEAKRANLAATIDELTRRTKPKEIVRRGAAGVGAKARGAVATPDGNLRTERIGAVAGATLVVLVALFLLRRRR
jgi:hypothetical protein